MYQQYNSSSFSIISEEYYFLSFCFLSIIRSVSHVPCFISFLFSCFSSRYTCSAIQYLNDFITSTVDLMCCCWHWFICFCCLWLFSLHVRLLITRTSPCIYSRDFYLTIRDWIFKILSKRMLRHKIISSSYMTYCGLIKDGNITKFKKFIKNMY